MKTAIEQIAIDKPQRGEVSLFAFMISLAAIMAFSTVAGFLAANSL